VARTEPRAEFIAAKRLERAGYDVFFPLIDEPNAQNENTRSPLFPGYLFLHCDPENGGWPSFQGIDRILGWVKFGGEIPILPDSDIAELKNHLDSINNQGGILKTFSPGEKVHLNVGNLRCLAEVVSESRSPQARIKVLLQFMGRQIQAQVPRNSLRALDDSPEEPYLRPRQTRGRGRWIKGFGARSQVTA
jgi:transcriptional antiterminator RfaH